MTYRPRWARLSEHRMNLVYPMFAMVVLTVTYALQRRVVPL